ncbi:MAG: DUF2530 domain-containing protein [Micromonosporaceae bacterium]
MPRRPPRQITEPFEVPMMPFAVAGTVLWALAGLVLLVFREELVTSGRASWLWTCLAGVLAGLLGILTMHTRARRQRG